MNIFTVKKSNPASFFVSAILVLNVLQSHGLGESVDSTLAHETPSISSTPLSVLARKVQESYSIEGGSESALSYEGPTFMVGLELKTTSQGEINRRAVGDALSTQLFTYVWDELPYRYELKNIAIDDIQKLSVELIRKLRRLEPETQTHEFVVMANTEFSTDQVPSKTEIVNVIVGMQLPASVFQSSDDEVLKTTISARFLPLRTSQVALAVKQDDPVEESSVLEEYSMVIFLSAGLSFLILLASLTYYIKTSQQSADKVNSEEDKDKETCEDMTGEGVFVSNESSLEPSLDIFDGKSKVISKDELDEVESEEPESIEPPFPCDKSLVDKGVLLVESESCSDESLVEERGFNEETMSLMSRISGFSRISRYSLSPQQEKSRSRNFKKKTQELDIDTVQDDSDSDVVRRNKKKIRIRPSDDFRLKATVVDEVAPSGMRCGMGLPMTGEKNSPLDIDTVIAESDSESEEEGNGKKSKKRHSKNKNVALVPRMRYSTKSTKRKKSQGDIFAVFSDEDVRGGCAFGDVYSVAEEDSSEGGCEMKTPKQLVDEVIEEAIEEGYDCGMSLAGF